MGKPGRKKGGEGEGSFSMSKTRVKIIYREGNEEGTLSLPPSHLPSLCSPLRMEGGKGVGGRREGGKEDREGKEHARPRGTIY